MFRAATLVIIDKIDLLPCLDFDLDNAAANLNRANPTAPVLQLSARTGEGIGDWDDWMRRQSAAARGSIFWVDGCV